MRCRPVELDLGNKPANLVLKVKTNADILTHPIPEGIKWYHFCQSVYIRIFGKWQGNNKMLFELFITSQLHKKDKHVCKHLKVNKSSKYKKVDKKLILIWPNVIKPNTVSSHRDSFSIPLPPYVEEKRQLKNDRPHLSFASLALVLTWKLWWLTLNRRWTQTPPTPRRVLLRCLSRGTCTRSPCALCSCTSAPSPYRWDYCRFPAA